MYGSSPEFIPHLMRDGNDEGIGTRMTKEGLLHHDLLRGESLDVYQVDSLR